LLQTKYAGAEGFFSSAPFFVKVETPISELKKAPEQVVNSLECGGPGAALVRGDWSPHR